MILGGWLPQFAWSISKILVPTLCRADLGWIFYFGAANFRKICQRISMANFDSDFFGLVFPGFQATPKNHAKIHVQNCRHSSPISLSWTQNLLSSFLWAVTTSSYNSIWKSLWSPQPPSTVSATKLPTGLSLFQQLIRQDITDIKAPLSDCRLFLDSRVFAVFVGKFCTGSVQTGSEWNSPCVEKGEKCVEKREKCAEKGEKCVEKGGKRAEKGENCIGKGEKCVEKGENHSDPIYTNPIKNLPTLKVQNLLGTFLYLQFELFWLQLIFFAYSPLRCLLDALSHCKQTSYSLWTLCSYKTGVSMSSLFSGTDRISLR